MGAKRTILVVEDELELIELFKPILEDSNYDLLIAGDFEAFDGLWTQFKEEIDVVLADIILPNGDLGTNIAKICFQDRPSIPLLFMSGYSFFELKQLLGEDFDLVLKQGLIKKPFESRILLAELDLTIQRTPPNRD